MQHSRPISEVLPDCLRSFLDRRQYSDGSPGTGRNHGNPSGPLQFQGPPRPLRSVPPRSASPPPLPSAPAGLAPIQIQVRIFPSPVGRRPHLAPTADAIGLEWRSGRGCTFHSCPLRLSGWLG